MCICPCSITTYTYYYMYNTLLLHVHVCAMSYTHVSMKKFAVYKYTTCIVVQISTNFMSYEKRFTLQYIHVLYVDVHVYMYYVDVRTYIHTCMYIDKPPSPSHMLLCMSRGWQTDWP